MTAEIDVRPGPSTLPLNDISESERHLRAVIDRLDAIVWVADGEQLQPTFVNQQAEAILGYSVAQWLSEPIWTLLLHPEERERVLALWRAAPTSGDTVACVHRCVALDGRVRWFNTSLHYIAGDAQMPAYLQGLMLDITAHHQTEELLREADRVRSELITNVSHELRTPLHHIKGYASTLLRPRVHFDQTTVQEYLRIIAEETDKLERLIADLLDTSGNDASFLSCTIDSVQIDEIILKVVRRWQGIEAHTFALRMPEILPPIPADPIRIEQVLDNLFANVVRHTPSHTLATISVDVSRTQVLVSVADQGPGIGAEHLPYLFDRCYQAGEHAYRRHRGSGLGLFLCKGIIEQHGGSIWVELPPDSGTTFRFALPRRRAHTKHRGSASGSGDRSSGHCS